MRVDGIFFPRIELTSCIHREYNNEDSCQHGVSRVDTIFYEHGMLCHKLNKYVPGDPAGKITFKIQL